MLPSRPKKISRTGRSKLTHAPAGADCGDGGTLGLDALVDALDSGDSEAPTLAVADGDAVAQPLTASTRASRTRARASRTS